MNQIQRLEAIRLESAWLTRIGRHLRAEFEPTATREGWYLVRHATAVSLEPVYGCEEVPGVLLCDGDLVGAHGERYYYLGELA